MDEVSMFQAQYAAQSFKLVRRTDIEKWMRIVAAIHQDKIGGIAWCTLGPQLVIIEKIDDDLFRVTSEKREKSPFRRALVSDRR